MPLDPEAGHVVGPGSGGTGAVAVDPFTVEYVGRGRSGGGVPAPDSELGHAGLALDDAGLSDVGEEGGEGDRLVGGGYGAGDNGAGGQGRQQEGEGCGGPEEGMSGCSLHCRGRCGRGARVGGYAR